MKRENVLIIDDEPALRLGLSASLRTEGYETEECESIAAAARRLEDGPPSAVLLDIQLTDGSGLDLLPKIRSGHARAIATFRTIAAVEWIIIVAIVIGTVTMTSLFSP